MIDPWLCQTTWYIDVLENLNHFVAEKQAWLAYQNQVQRNIQGLGSGLEF